MRKQILMSITLLLFLGFYQPSHSQNHSNDKKQIAQKFSRKSEIRGTIWLYDSIRNDLQNIDSPILKKYLPDIAFYKVNMTGILDHHINQVDCIILVDNSNSESIEFIPELWYSGFKKEFFTALFSPKFDSQDDLQKFILTVFNILESITPTMRFTNINFTPGKMSCELIEVSRENDAVWRKVQIDFKNNKIEKLVTINPKMNTTNTIEL